MSEPEFTHDADTAGISTSSGISQSFPVGIVRVFRALNRY